MLALDLLKFIVNVIYVPFKLLKTKNKITFISRQSNNISLEFKLIIERLKKENKSVEIKTIAKKLEFNIKSIIINVFLMFRLMYHIATSKIVVVDGYCIPVSILKHKKDLIIIQMWHANGIIKKIGLQTLNNRSKWGQKLALKMNMHKNYNYVISSSDITSKIFIKAFGVKKKNIVKLGTPILDYLYNGKYKEKELEIRNKYNLGSKENIVYMPTLRYANIEMDEFIKHFDFNKYNLILKVHPLQKINNKDKNIINISNYSGEDALAVADYVITDYSNIAFEAILVGKPVYFYLFDIDEYKKYPGLNVDLFKELPDNTASDIKVILKKINAKRIYMKKLQKFVEKHIQTYDGKCVDRIIAFLIELLD